MRLALWTVVVAMWFSSIVVLFILQGYLKPERLERSRIVPIWLPELMNKENLLPEGHKWIPRYLALAGSTIIGGVALLFATAFEIV